MVRLLETTLDFVPEVCEPRPHRSLVVLWLLTMVPSHYSTSPSGHARPPDEAERLLSQLWRNCSTCRTLLSLAPEDAELSHLSSHAVLLLGRGDPPPSASWDDTGALANAARPRLSPLASSVPFREKLARALIDESRLSLPSDSCRAQRAAALALAILEGLTSLEARELRLAACLHRANALLRQGDCEKAGRILDRHVEEISELPPGALRGDLHSLAGVIRQDLGRPQDALLHHLLARSEYLALPDNARTATALLRIASLLRAAADLPEAIATAAEAVRLTEEGDDASVFLCARHNLAAYLIDAGLEDEARELLTEVLHLYPTTRDSPTLLRYRWLVARLAAGAGEVASAAATYADLRERFLAQGLGRDAALVTVDLADLSLQSRDTAGCRRALEWLRPILQDHPLARRAPEVHGLLSVVAEAKLVTPPVLRELTALVRTC